MRRNFVFIVLYSLVIGTLVGQEIKNIGVDISPFSTDYFSLPLIDLDDHREWQTVIDREEGQYLGHPTTVLLPDGKTIFIVYPKGHGRGSIVMKKSEDGGLHWSERLPVPDNWSTSQEVPTLYPVTDSLGKTRVIMFSGRYPARMAYSNDWCTSWSPLTPLGDWGGIVVMGDVVDLHTGAGHYLALFHDDERYFTAQGRPQHS
ncbi:MAG: exo-alpha-sialidase, partial [Saprospiraceae bacterium]|nr:exo-alpha-sialidase [Saprospiraceae bacterium]